MAISRDSVGIIWRRWLLVVGSGAKESEKVGPQGGGFGWRVSDDRCREAEEKETYQVVWTA